MGVGVVKMGSNFVIGIFVVGVAPIGLVFACYHARYPILVQCLPANVFFSIDVNVAFYSFMHCFDCGLLSHLGQITI